MLVSAIHQHESAIGIHTSLPSWTSLPPQAVFLGWGVCDEGYVVIATDSWGFYLFMAVLGFHCCTQAFPSCGSWGLLSNAVHCSGFSCGARALEHSSTVVVAHRLSCPEACGFFLDRGSNPYPLHWQANSLPLSHEGSPTQGFEPPQSMVWTKLNLPIRKSREGFYFSFIISLPGSEIF